MANTDFLFLYIALLNLMLVSAIYTPRPNTRPFQLPENFWRFVGLGLILLAYAGTITACVSTQQ